jgi:hypothetical protein
VAPSVSCRQRYAASMMRSLSVAGSGIGPPFLTKPSL